MKEKLYQEIDSVRQSIDQLSRDIRSNPELAFEEHKAAAFMIALLSAHGFDIEFPVGGVDTAFKATFNGKSGGPTVAFMAEYDALPEMGHACGHNLIAMASAGAGIGLSKLMGELPGKIVILGTPAEEVGGGKIVMIKGGAFDGIDFALMAHPSRINRIGGQSLAISDVTIEFFGRPAHSSAPEKGINALSAVLHTFYLVDAMRTNMPTRTNINGIINSGGVASNIIPEYAKCTFAVRAATLHDLKKVIDRIKTAIRCAETATGARAVVDIESPYSESYENSTMAEMYKKYMDAMGETVGYPAPSDKFGSSDTANVQIKLPAIQPAVQVCDPSLAGHTLEFRDACVTDHAHEAMGKAAKAMAATALDILTDEALRNTILDEFNRVVPKYTDEDTNIAPYKS